MIREACSKDIYILDNFVTDFVKYEAINYDSNNKQDLIITGYIENKMKNKDNIIFVYEDKNDIVGFIMGGFIRGNLVKKTDEVKIDVLYVLEKYRNKGIGTELINTFINECKNRNVSYVRIDNFLANESAGNLYDKLGFDVLVVERRKKID